MNKFKGIHLQEIAKIILGKIFFRPVLILFACFFIFCYTACMLIGGIFVVGNVLLGTPLPAYLLFSYAIVTYMFYHGVGTIGRMAVVFISFIMFTIVCFSLWNRLIDVKVVLPILADSRSEIE
jgi:hypothetical protein